MKINKPSFSAFVCIVSTLSIASLSLANTCLKEATNQQLVDELSSRLNGGSPTGTAGIVTFSCYHEDLSIALVTSDATEAAPLVLDLPNPSECNYYRDALTPKVSKISSLTVVAICDFEDLYRIAITPEGLKQLATQDLNTAANCRKEADAINSRI